MAGVGAGASRRHWQAIQAMRTELHAPKILRYWVFSWPIDTDMAQEFDFPKTSHPAPTATIFTAKMQLGQEDIFPDTMSAEMAAVAI